MSKYDPLKSRLTAFREDSLALSFEEIEGLIGQPLPPSSRDYDEWWSNEDPKKTTHSQSKAWVTAGFTAEVDRLRRHVTFRRK
ncbi:DUF7662 domain-containing protein [Bradyrhizobium sp. 930_D9_N1_4]|uniref:DUF7662 domain-containing protein n=1 Tax=Bradyrhizobium sp. 930_D9_N1_4 TaxID=3240374 RepID=UPI003F897F62